MKDKYESTRNNKIEINASEAIIKGISDDGGLFVLKDLNKLKVDLNILIKEDYLGICSIILNLFLNDFTIEEIKDCVNKAYKNKFNNDNITPLVKLKDTYILELFHGPTSAFKDIGLSILPYLIQKSLIKNNDNNKILILTATSGDTGKAALEGFKNINNTKIIVFYPKDKVSIVQKRQMITQEGHNTIVCSINGNFDDAQNGVKELLLNEDLIKQLELNNIKVSSANSINIGRLIPQIVYYFYAYKTLVSNNTIKLKDKVNFVVPTGNFGNILAGYYAKAIGLPINKLICACNENNVLYDFFNTGIYNINRNFKKTISPSMDILISSNLERLLYYSSNNDHNYIKKLMESLKNNGYYKLDDHIFDKIKETFISGYATNKETKDIIKEIYKKDHYLLDPHTAVAYKVLLDQKDNKNINIVLATASPYKFTNSVYQSIYGKTNDNEFTIMDKLYNNTNIDIPNNLKQLETKKILHKDNINKDNMKEYILKKVNI